MTVLVEVPTPGPVRLAPAVLLVVVPARDEERRLPGCLGSLAVAAGVLRELDPQVEVRVVVAADRCRDATVRVAADAGAAVVEVEHGRVGAARRAGVQAALTLTGQAADLTWVACTDADSRVPPGWLLAHRRTGAGGASARVGTVRLDDGPLARPVREAWRAEYAVGGRLGALGGHGHVHGANLGVRAAAYAEVGGFADVDRDEDVSLVDRLLAAGHRVDWSVDDAVRTSSRTVGTVPGGFGEHLARLA